jgi:hypothetical protein
MLTQLEAIGGCRGMGVVIGIRRRKFAASRVSVSGHCLLGMWIYSVASHRSGGGGGGGGGGQMVWRSGRVSSKEDYLADMLSFRYVERDVKLLPASNPCDALLS